MSRSEKKNLEIAKAVGQYMADHDLFGKMLGLKLEMIEPGCARVSVEITNVMVNGHGICHGGLTFSLADTAFAYACNSRNHRTVALNCLISFVKAVEVGSILTAAAEEKSLTGRTGVFDITVTNQYNEVVALFRGTSYRSREAVLAHLHPGDE